MNEDKSFEHKVWLMESSSGMQNWNLAKAMANVFRSVWNAIKSVKDDTAATRTLLATLVVPPFRRLARKNFGRRVRTRTPFVRF